MRLYLDDFSEEVERLMVVGGKPSCPHSSFSALLMGGWGLRVCAIEYVTGSLEKVMLLSTQCLYGGIASWTLSFSYVLVVVGNPLSHSVLCPCMGSHIPLGSLATQS